MKQEGSVNARNSKREGVTREVKAKKPGKVNVAIPGNTTKSDGKRSKRREMLKVLDWTKENIKEVRTSTEQEYT